MEKIELEIVALSHSITNSHSYAVVLGEVEGNRRLPIVIGGFEAQSIALALEQMKPKRPMTHDMAKGILDEFNIVCKEIIIDDLTEGVFHAKLVCANDNYEQLIDSRTSDAIAMAVRFECPIYTYEFVLEQAGIILDVEEEVEEKMMKRRKMKVKIQSNEDFSGMTIAELNKMLNQLLENEEYEKAIVIRDELNKREAGEGL